MPQGQVLLYEETDGAPIVEVRLEAGSVWLSQQQIAELFQTSRTNVVEHIAHVYEEGELDESATCRNLRQVRTEGGRQVARELPFYNLDLIISVGYRVRSGLATKFRIWATQRLREHLVQGYTLNDRRLEQLGSIVTVLARSPHELVAGVAEVVATYLPSLRALREYDEGEITPTGGTMPTWALTYGEARTVVDKVGAEFPDDTLFGGERGGALRGIVETIYQGFGGVELYPTLQEKAANLLYLVVKDHPLTDGNKRSAAALFVHFLARNGALEDVRGVPRISNNALAAMTLMVAMSDPKEKELMIALLVSMLAADPS